MNLQQKAEMLGETIFLGVPVKDFEKGGRELLIYLLNAGLNPDSRVVDIGCGVLRGGYWLIHFLDPGCYCGIEPDTERLAIGTRTILEPEILEAKRPRFDTNPHFDTSVFGEKFNFFLAYSVWTHASKSQIQTMLTRSYATRKTAACFSPPTCRRAGHTRTIKATSGTGRVTSRTYPAAFIIASDG